MTLDQSLLLNSTKEFDESNLLYKIRQSIIDLENNPSENEIQNLLNQSISYLDEYLDYQTKDDLFILISRCLSLIHDKKREFYKEIYENSQKNSNRLIVFAMIFSEYDEKTSLEELPELINKIRDQVFDQIQNPKDKFKICDNEIDQKYVGNFIIDITLISELNENLISTFLPFIFKQNYLSDAKINKLIQKISNSNFISTIPEFILSDKRFFSTFSQENLSVLIPKTTNQTFLQILQIINNDIDSKFKSLIQPFANSILEKYVEFDIEFKEKDKLFINILESFNEVMMTQSVFNYLLKYNVNFKEYSIHQYISDDIIEQILRESNDLEAFEKIIDCDFENINVEIFSDKKFWVRLFSVVSSSKIKYSFDLLQKFAELFEKYVEQDKSYEIIESMIFDKFPTTQKGNYFLCNFLSQFSPKYVKNFKSNSETLFKRVIENKILPLPSFWSLFDKEFIESFLKNENNDPMILYAYHFTPPMIKEKKMEDEIEITINPLKNEKDSNLILEVIKNKDLNSLAKLNEETLLLVISTIDGSNRPESFTYDESTVIPLIAIPFIFDTALNDNLKNDFMLDNIFLKSIRNLPKLKSPLLIESINAIISNSSKFYNIFPFSNHFYFRFYDILINQLIDGTYIADKLILIKEIFDFPNKYTSFHQTEYLFDKNGINLLNFLIQNISEIDGFDTIQNTKFDINILNLKKVISLSNKITNYKYAANAIYFFDNYCKCPVDFFDSIKPLINFCIKNMQKMEIDDFLIVYEYIKKHDLDKNLSFNDISININALLNKLKSKAFDRTYSWYFELIFHKLMKEKSIANDYFIIKLEKCSYKQTVKIQSKCFYEYKNNLTFLKAFHSIFRCNDKTSKFIRRAHFNSITYPLSKTGLSIISKLLKIGNFQAYYFLYCMASSFPFLFTKNPEKLFTQIFPKLNSFSLIFTLHNDSDKSLIEELKFAILIFHFLISLLYSVKILDAFLPWFYTNIETFSPSQILSIFYILNYLYKIKKLKVVTLAVSIKYNFPEIASKLLKRNVSKEIRESYREKIFMALELHYLLLNDLGFKKKRFVFVNELACLKNPFEIALNNFSTILPHHLFQIELFTVDNIEVLEFIRSLLHEKYNWVLFEESEYDYYLNEKDLLNKSILSKFPCFNEHSKPIKNDMNILKKFKKEIYEKNKDFEKNDIDFYFYDQFCQNDLINILIKEIEKNSINFDELIVPLISLVGRSNIGLICFLDVFNIYIAENKVNNKLIDKLFNTLFKKNSELLANYIINFSLTPEFRTNTDFLSNISVLLQQFNLNFPCNIGQLIGFMLISNKEETIEKALELCTKVDERYLINIQKIIKSVIGDRFNSRKTPSISLFKKIIQVLPSYVKSNIDNTIKVLNKVIHKYTIGEDKNDETLDFIFNLLNVLAPERQQNQLINPIDEIDFSLSLTYNQMNSLTQSSNQSILKQAPQNLVETNPTFWNLYNKNRSFLNDIVTNNEDYLGDLRFLEDFPELVSFDKRLSTFRKKMKSKIDEYEELNVTVDRSSILIDSFATLYNKTREEWLSKIKVKFIGEYGIDMGGLTKEWFTLIIKELFNPNFALFILCENKSYKPNQLSGINREHIDYFRFAGKIIARAIIQGQCVNAHFCRSFCRQILRHQVKLKDLVDLGTSVYNSMQHILNNDPEPLALNFTINIDEYGSCKTILLKENGDEIDVTNENKVEYATLYAKYYLRSSILDQINAFCEGFNWLIPHEEIKMFSPDELDLIICGIPEIDIDDLKENTSYAYPYDENHPVIIMFFNAISKWDPENLAKFLLFLTGSSQVPVNGFKDYSDSGCPITIAPGGDRTRLCVAHTCFNTLDLPEYEDEDELNEKLLQSIQECEFGVL